MKCPNCDKEVEQIEGKRQKQFCNSTCRSNYWQKSNRLKKAKVVSAKIEKVDGKTMAKVVFEEPKPEKKMVDNEYGFDAADRWLLIEEYTKHPKKEMPTNIWQQSEWLKQKEISDSKIKLAWQEWKKSQK